MILNKKPFFWFLLSLPAMFMLPGYWSGETIAMDMVPPTGDWAARFMIAAMMLSPLLSLIGPRPWLNWLIRRRRSLGVGAFAYAVLHLLFYLIDMNNLGDILAEFWALGIWPGWAAMLLFIPLALTSNDASMRTLKGGWKRLQKLVYPAALFVLVHWVFIHDSTGTALAHFMPLAMLIAARFVLSLNPQIKGAY